LFRAARQSLEFRGDAAPLVNGMEGGIYGTRFQDGTPYRILST
jgi:hypothetical protein